MEVLNPQKILVIQTAFLGDAVLTLPMIQQLKLENQECKICVLCIPSTNDLFCNSPAVDQTIVFDKRKKDKSFFSFVKLITSIRNQKFDLVYSPHRSLRSTFISFFALSKISVGFDISAYSGLYKRTVKYKPDLHEVARNLSLIGFDTSRNKWRIKPELNISETVNKKIGILIDNIVGKRIIAIAPGSVWNTKVYPKEYFVELIRMLIENNFYIFLVGGKEDKFLCREIAGNFIDKAKSFAGELSIVESVALIKKCEAIICNDSAPTHLAMIADIPALTIYCSTVPSFGFFPYNERSKFISYDDLTCKPCGIHGHKKCPIKTYDCANKLIPEIVFRKLKEIIPV